MIIVLVKVMIQNNILHQATMVFFLLGLFALIISNALLPTSGGTNNNNRNDEKVIQVAVLLPGLDKRFDINRIDQKLQLRLNNSSMPPIEFSETALLEKVFNKAVSDENDVFFSMRKTKTSQLSSPTVRIKPFFVDSSDALSEMVLMLRFQHQQQQPALDTTMGYSHKDNNYNMPIVALMNLNQECSFDQIIHLKESAKKSPRLTTVSLCPSGITSDANNLHTLTNRQETQQGNVTTDEHRLKIAVADVIDGATMASFLQAMAHRFKWHHFHFIVTPQWEAYDELIRVANATLAIRNVLVPHHKIYANENDDVDVGEQQRIILNEMTPNYSNGSVEDDRLLLNLTKSIYCTQRLANGRLCDFSRWFQTNFIKNDAAAIFLLLDPNNDLPNFINKLSSLIDNEAALTPLQREILLNKAIFIMPPSGFLDGDTAVMLRNQAPPGLMVITAKQPFDSIIVPLELPSPSAVFFNQHRLNVTSISNNSNNFEATNNSKAAILLENIMLMHGVATVLYNKMRVLTRVINQFQQQQQPDNAPTSLANFYCGTTFAYEIDSSFRYDKNCSRTSLSLRIFNVMDGKLAYINRRSTLNYSNNKTLVQFINVTLSQENDLNGNYYDKLYRHLNITSPDDGNNKLLVPVLDFINDNVEIVEVATSSSSKQQIAWLDGESTPPTENLLCFQYYYSTSNNNKQHLIKIKSENNSYCLEATTEFNSDLIAAIAVSSFAALIITIVVGIFLAVDAKRRRRKKYERFLAEIVAKFDEIFFSNERDETKATAGNKNDTSTVSNIIIKPDEAPSSQHNDGLKSVQSSVTAVREQDSNVGGAAGSSIEAIVTGGAFGGGVDYVSKITKATKQQARQTPPLQQRVTAETRPSAMMMMSMTKMKSQRQLPSVAAGQLLRAKFRSADVFVTLLKKSTCYVDDNEVVEELKETRQLQHVNINRLLAITTEPYHICIIQDYCSKGTLAAVLSRKKIQLDRLFKLSFASDIAAGISYLHQSSVGSHGRLTSSNILVDSRWFCKIANLPLPKFELSDSLIKSGSLLSGSNKASRSRSQQHKKDVDSDDDDSNIKDNNNKEKSNSSRDADGEQQYAHLVDKFWTAPEMLRRENPPPRGCKKADVYSFGIILYEIITREKPYEHYKMSNGVVFRNLLDGTYPAFRPYLGIVDHQLWDLAEICRLCWDEVSAFRPDFSSINKMLCKGNKGKETNLIDQMMAMLENYANNLESEVIARTGELDNERHRSEELLKKMLPRAVVEDLKAGRIVHPETFESVTVYFSDIVGFTKMASSSAPLEIVDFLNDLYSEFDNVIDRFDVYKVETVSDAYMVASGLPIRNGIKHASEIATMSLEMLSCVTSFKIRHRPGEQLQLRIGMHSGSVVAGIIGLRMPRYCLFGDTVNYASRMESSGLALRIHVSPETKTLLDKIGGFHLEKRGLVSMKGKGTVQTYHLTGKDGWTKPLPDLNLAASIEEHEFK